MCVFGSCYVHCHSSRVFASQVTQDNGVSYWLEFGTMLGASRSGKFIPWDHDLDFGTIREEFMPKLPAITTALKRRGYILQTTDGCKYFIQSTTKDVNGANIVFRFEVFIFTLATRAQQLVFYRQYSTQFAKLRIEEVSTSTKSLATSSPLSSETVSSGHFANTPILTRCNLLDYWRYSIPKSYVDDLVGAEFEGIKSFVPRQMKEVLRLYRFSHSYWFSLPYKVNCCFTCIEYMWLPTSAIFAIAIIILLVTKLCRMFKSKTT